MNNKEVLWAAFVGVGLIGLGWAKVLDPATGPALKAAGAATAAAGVVTWLSYWAYLHEHAIVRATRDRGWPGPTSVAVFTHLWVVTIVAAGALWALEHIRA